MEPAFTPGQRNNGVIPPGNRDFFCYPAAFAALAVAVPATTNINISADSDFYLTSLTYFADIAAALQTDATRVLPLINVQITDTGSGRQLLNAAVQVSTFAGTGDRPFRLIHPRKFARSTTIQVVATNAAVAGTVYATFTLNFVGFKLYELGRA